MPRKIIAVFVALILISSASVALARDFGLNRTREAARYRASQGNVYGIINRAVSITLSLLAIIFFSIMIYAGIRWMTARGNDELAGKAQNALIAGSIGFIIVIFAYAITAFLFSKMGPSGSSAQQCSTQVTGGTCKASCDTASGEQERPFSCPSSQRCCAPAAVPDPGTGAPPGAA